MASILQLAVSAIQINNCVTLVILITIGYDYILTFADEVEYIWKKPWTWVSTLFVVARYLGICSVVFSTLIGSSFLPGPTNVTVSAFTVYIVYFTQGRLKGNITYIFGDWGIGVFIAAADLVMILRVWALYNRSRFVLGILLTLYAMEIIAYVVSSVLPSTQDGPEAVSIQVLDYSFCTVQFGSPIGPMVTDCLQITLGTLMCALLAVRFTKDFFGTFRLRGVQPNRYLTVLAREGMFYFLATLSYAAINLFGCIVDLSTDRWWTLLGVAQYIPACTLVPRFILSLRQLYALDVQGRRGSHIDTAFGLTIASVNASGMAFAGDGENEWLDE